MTPQDLLDELVRIGVPLAREGDTLRVSAPTPPSAEVQAALKEHKAALLALFERLDPDPRPDRVEDAGLWHRLFTLAQGDEGAPDGLYGVLRGFRSLGAQLVRYSRGVRLQAGEIDEVEYADLRFTWLEPHRDKLLVLLRQVAGEREAA